MAAPTRPAMLLLLLLVFATPARAGSPSCSAEAGRNLVRSMAKIHRFLESSRRAASFNYDRLDFLLDKFKTREEAWAACGGPARSRQDRLLRGRLDRLRRKLALARSLVPGASPVPLSAFPEIETLFSGLPKDSSSGAPGKRKEEEVRPFSFVLSPGRRGVLLAGILLAGVAVLYLALRGSLPAGEGREAPEDPAEIFRGLGERWARFRSSRTAILRAMKDRLGRGKGRVLIRAQLLKKGAEGGEWTVADEIVEDEGGLVRTFRERRIPENPEESLVERPLGEGEVRTRMLLPLAGEEGEPLVLLVDALSAPEIDFLLPDPSGLRSFLQMKEILFELSQDPEEKAERTPVGVISFLFDDPAKVRLLEDDGEESLRAREFVVGEIGRLAGDSMAIFGEPPGVFHLVVSGWTESRTGVLIRKIADGLGPEAGKGEGGTLEKPWYRKVLVAYTHWQKPDPAALDLFLSRVRGNIDRLRAHPSIGTVIDH